MELRTSKLHVSRVRCQLELRTSKLHVGRVQTPMQLQLQNFMSVVENAHGASNFRTSCQSCTMPLQTSRYH
eukprot:5469024-Pyramimonas_sp.AAC.1